MPDTRNQLLIDFSQRHRNTDPASSQVAAEKMIKSGKASKQALEVLEALRKFNGSTSKELAELSGLDRYVVARRLPDLRDNDYVTREIRVNADCRWWLV